MEYTVTLLKRQP